VEDYEYLQKTMTGLLENQGLKIVTAKNGLDGFEKFKAFEKNYFDLILTDLRMDVMDGETMIFHIKEYERKMKYERTPILVMTGYCSLDN
jgi:CheY-like chemotaxis protein